LVRKRFPRFDPGRGLHLKGLCGEKILQKGEVHG